MQSIYSCLGTDNKKASTVVEHESSAIHTRSQEVENAQKSKSSDPTPGQQALLMLKKELCHHMTGLFRAAHALGKHDCPIHRVCVADTAPTDIKAACSLLSIHCFTYRLELAYKDALKSVKLAYIIDTLLLNEYLMYNRSGSMRRAMQL